MLFWLCFGWDFGEVTSRRVCVCNGDKGPLWDSEKGNSACDIREVSGNRRRPADVGEWGGGEAMMKSTGTGRRRRGARRRCLIDGEMWKASRCGADEGEGKKVTKTPEN